MCCVVFSAENTLSQYPQLKLLRAQVPYSWECREEMTVMPRHCLQLSETLPLCSSGACQRDDLARLDSVVLRTSVAPENSLGLGWDCSYRRRRKPPSPSLPLCSEVIYTNFIMIFFFWPWTAATLWTFHTFICLQGVSLFSHQNVSPSALLWQNLSLI